MRGPKPKPKPDPNAKPPKPPDDLDGEALKEWRRIVKLLMPARVLNEKDHAALYVYATSFAEYKHAQAMIREHGAVVLSQSGIPQKSPWVTAANACWDRIRPLLAEFGMTPSSRARLQMDDVADDDGEFSKGGLWGEMDFILTRKPPTGW